MLQARHGGHGLGEDAVVPCVPRTDELRSVIGLNSAGVQIHPASEQMLDKKLPKERGVAQGSFI